MLIAASTDVVRVRLGGTPSTQLPIVSSWRDVAADGSTFAPGRTLTVSNSTTNVSAVPSPGGSVLRICDFISIYNADAAAQTVTVAAYDGSAERILIVVALSPGERLEYSDSKGFRVLTVLGAEKTAQALAAAPAGQLNIVILSGDVANAHATPNTILDVTGLSFPVTGGETYLFEFVIPYTSAATTTGSRWAINGPASPTQLNYRSEYTLAATTTTVNSATAYDIPAACNATSLTAGNVATIWGVIKPASSGNVIARFASEVTVSAITAKAGATLRWIRVL